MQLGVSVKLLSCCDCQEVSAPYQKEAVRTVVFSVVYWFETCQELCTKKKKKNRVREAKKWEWSGGKPKCTTNIKAADCDVNHLLRFPRARERTFNLKKPYSCYMSACYK